MAAVETLIIRSQLLDRRGRLESARTAHPDADHLARLLDEVDAALVRMDQGVYGLCESCHDQRSAVSFQPSAFSIQLRTVQRAPG